MDYTIMNEDGSKTIYSFNGVDSTYIDKYIRGFKPKATKHIGAKGDRNVLTASVVNSTRPEPSSTELLARRMFHLA